METSHYERRVRTRALIEKMLTERREVLVMLLRVSGVEPYGEGAPVASTLHEFRQLLTDYIASAHFGLYARIVEGTERRQPVVDIARRSYTEIARTTETAIAFADKYEGLEAGDDAPLPAQLHSDLSRLGETLARRIELEDELITAMLGELGTELCESHAPQVVRAAARPPRRAASAASRG